VALDGRLGYGNTTSIGDNEAGTWKVTASLAGDGSLMSGTAATRRFRAG
jgi:hypothetical protein